MEALEIFADADAAATALLAAALALCATAVVVAAACMAFVAKLITGWDIAFFGRRKNPRP